MQGKQCRVRTNHETREFTGSRRSPSTRNTDERRQKMTFIVDLSDSRRTYERKSRPIRVGTVRAALAATFARFQRNHPQGAAP